MIGKCTDRSTAVRTSSVTSPPLVSIVKIWISGTDAVPRRRIVVSASLYAQAMRWMLATNFSRSAVRTLPCS